MLLPRVEEHTRISRCEQGHAHAFTLPQAGEGQTNGGQAPRLPLGKGGSRSCAHGGMKAPLGIFQDVGQQHGDVILHLFRDTTVVPLRPYANLVHVRPGDNVRLGLGLGLGVALRQHEAQRCHGVQASDDVLVAPQLLVPHEGGLPNVCPPEQGALRVKLNPQNGRVVGGVTVHPLDLFGVVVITFGALPHVAALVQLAHLLVALDGDHLTRLREYLLVHGALADLLHADGHFHRQDTHTRRRRLLEHQVGFVLLAVVKVRRSDGPCAGPMNPGSEIRIHPLSNACAARRHQRLSERACADNVRAVHCRTSFRILQRSGRARGAASGFLLRGPPQLVRQASCAAAMNSVHSRGALQPQLRQLGAFCALRDRSVQPGLVVGAHWSETAQRQPRATGRRVQHWGDGGGWHRLPVPHYRSCPCRCSSSMLRHEASRVRSPQQQLLHRLLHHHHSEQLGQGVHGQRGLQRQELLPHRPRCRDGVHTLRTAEVPAVSHQGQAWQGGGLCWAQGQGVSMQLLQCGGCLHHAVDAHVVLVLVGEGFDVEQGQPALQASNNPLISPGGSRQQARRAYPRPRGASRHDTTHIQRGIWPPR